MEAFPLGNPVQSSSGPGPSDPFLTDNVPPSKLLSILCQGRNDNYMGNFTWRLATVINNHARNFVTLGLEDEVELLVTDWGSLEPLYKALQLTEDARRLVRFLMVSPETAKIYDKDAGYSGTHPINAVARRGAGRYFLFSDSDVFIPLEAMAKLMHHLRVGHVHGLSLDDYFFWASKFHIPNQFVMQNPSLAEVDRHIAEHWTSYLYEEVSKQDFKGGGVCLLMRREMWFESRGWDEQFIYWGWYDIDWQKRLSQKYGWDLFENQGIRIFHFEHYRDRFAPESALKEIGRRTNPYIEPTKFAPNPENWGLRDHRLEFVDGFGMAIDPMTRNSESKAWLSFDPTKAPVSAEALIALNPLYRRVPAAFGVDYGDLGEPPLTLKRLLEQLKPRLICEVGSNLGRVSRLLAGCSFSEKVFCVDLWDRERAACFFQGRLSDRVLGHLFEQFLANVFHAGLAGKIYPLRLPDRSAADYCRRQNLYFDLICIGSYWVQPGARRELIVWLAMLSQFGVICLEKPVGRVVPGSFAPEVAQLVQAKNLTLFDEADCLVLVPQVATQAQ